MEMARCWDPPKLWRLRFFFWEECENVCKTYQHIMIWADHHTSQTSKMIMYTDQGRQGLACWVYNWVVNMSRILWPSTSKVHGCWHDAWLRGWCDEQHRGNSGLTFWKICLISLVTGRMVPHTYILHKPQCQVKPSKPSQKSLNHHFTLISFVFQHLILSWYPSKKTRIALKSHDSILEDFTELSARKDAGLTAQFLGAQVMPVDWPWICWVWKNDHLKSVRIMNLSHHLCGIVFWRECTKKTWNN